MLINDKVNECKMENLVPGKSSFRRNRRGQMPLATKAVWIGKAMTAQAASVIADATVVAKEGHYTVYKHSIAQLN